MIQSLITGLIWVGISTVGAYLAGAVTVWLIACQLGSMCS